MSSVKKHCTENNTETLQYRKQMPKTSLYSQSEIKVVRNCIFKQQACSLFNFFSGNSSGICFLIF